MEGFVVDPTRIGLELLGVNVAEVDRLKHEFEAQIGTRPTVVIVPTPKIKLMGMHVVFSDTVKEVRVGCPGE